jgi:ERCC4-type nuclease
MEIWVDTRERELIGMLKHFLEIMPACKGVSLVIKPLELGDIILSYQGSEKVIIERKSVGDLAASIKDGRYEEQGYRLNGNSMPNHNIVYLIEGDVNKVNSFKSKIDKMTLYSAMTSILLFKGFSIMRSSNMEESAIMICNMAYKIEKSVADGKQFYYKEQVLVNNEVTSEVVETNTSTIPIPMDKPDEKDYCAVVKRVKKENITKENIGEIMLCQIPGISSITALAIMKKYNNLPNLVNQLKENKDCLKDLDYTNASGQTRKISKTVIATIVNYLT